MKNRIIYICVAMVCLFMTSCDDMNSVHQKYLDMPEVNYIGIPKDVVALGGYNRVIFDWTLNADPKITTFVIEWTDLDGVLHTETTPVTRDAEGQLSHSIQLEEGSYNFVVYHTGNGDLRSLKTAVSARSFGSSYIASLSNRSFTLTATLNGASFTWDAADGVVQSIMKYETASGQVKTLHIDGSETSTLLPDFKIGGSFSLSTSYVPDGCVDEIACAEETFNFPKYIQGDISKYLGTYTITARVIPDWASPTTLGESKTWGPVVIEESDVAGYQFKVTGLMDPDTREAIGVEDFSVYYNWRYLEATPQDYIQSPQQSVGIACSFAGVDGTLYMTHKRTDNAAGGYGNAGWHFNYDAGTVFFGHYNNNGQNVLRFCMGSNTGTPIVDYYLPVLTKTE